MRARTGSRPGIEISGCNFHAKRLLADDNRHPLWSGQEAIMSLRQRFHQYEFSPVDKYRFFNQLIEPILSYGAEIWGHRAAPEMEVLHRRFLREILYVRRTTRKDLVYNELGAIPLKARWEINVAQENSKKLSSQLFLLQKDDTRANWASKARDTLIKYGFEDSWMSGPPVERRGFMERFKSVVWSTEQSKNCEEIEKGEGQARFYFNC